MRFVLVHGGFHGAWCWSKLVPELEKLGHTALPIDLPGAGGRMDEKASMASWRGALREVIEPGDILVGHSQGGFGISLGADEVPDKVARLIYLSAAVPIHGQSMHGASSGTDWSSVVGRPMSDFMAMVEHPVQGACTVMTSREASDKVFYHDCSPEDQAWAFSRFTPLPLAIADEAFDIPRFLTVPIPRDFISCSDDRSHPISADNRFMKRLGLTSGFNLAASHSPFVSMPGETAKLLDRCAGGVLT